VAEPAGSIGLHLVCRLLCATGLALILLVPAHSNASPSCWEEKLDQLPGWDRGAKVERVKYLAAQGDISAQFSLGSLYIISLMCDPNHDKGVLGTPTYEMAYELLLPSAIDGNHFAQFDIGGLLFTGLGVERNYSKAMYWLRKSADQGYVRAYPFIGDMYVNGWGVAEDTVEAAHWYLQAADAGHTPGQLRLGYMRMHGKGIDRDLVLAHRWLRLAAAGGSDKARQALRDLNEIIAPEQIAEAEREGEAWLKERGDKVKQKFADFHDLEKLLRLPEAVE
jgi:uncharacterized protein